MLRIILQMLIMFFSFKQRFQVMKQSKQPMRSIEDYTLLQKVGQGQYGYVYKAEHQTSKSLFAIKVMQLQKFKSVPKLTQLTNNQTAILSKINHPNIIKFIEMFQTSTHYYLVYEFCNGGTLEDKIKTQKMINQHDAVVYFAQLINAFAVLYENRILHRDIKPTNILFHNGKLKLADFGFCKQTPLNVMAKTIVGSPIYMAPQVLRGQQYDSRADIWSLGVVLYEMLYGHCPYEDNSIPRLISMISGTMLTFPKFPRVCDPLKIFMKRMLTMNSSERISPEQFTQYPIELVFTEKEDFPVLKMQIKGAIKFTRNNLLYLSQTLTKLAPQVNQLAYLRMAFLTYKIIMNIWRLTRRNSPYWEEIELPNNESRWEQYYQEEIQALKPYGEIVRDAIKQCDHSLKLKLELEKENIDTKYFIESLNHIPIENSQMREALINSLLINMHYMRVLDKKKPDWRDFTTIEKSYQEKEEYCLKYARYN